MAFQSVPETVEIAVTGLQGQQRLQNTFHARFIGGYSQADIDTLAGVIDQVVVDEWKPLWSNNCTYQGVIVRGLESSVDLIGTDGSGAGPGGVSSVPMPNSVALAVKKLSGFTGRSARGRIYVFGIPSNVKDADENFITVLAGNAFKDATEDIRIAIDLAGWVPVIVSRFADGIVRPTGVTFTWTDSQLSDFRFDSRRDRMP